MEDFRPKQRSSFCTSDFEHPDLNVVGGINCSGGRPFSASCKTGGDDDHYHGTHVAGTVAAGNNDADANNYSPGGFDNVLSVSALADFNGVPGGGAAHTCRSDIDDTLADFSNWGPEVDLAAPGVCILSTFPLEDGEYGAISGASMASPHVAGALALLASAANPGKAADVYTLYGQVTTAGNETGPMTPGTGSKSRSWT